MTLKLHCLLAALHKILYQIVMFDIEINKQIIFWSYWCPIKMK